MKCGVYLLEFSSGKFYLGSTNDLERRLVQHRLGMVRSAKRLGRLLGVVGFPACSTVPEARILEKKYKSWRSSYRVLATMQGKSSPDRVGVGPRFES